ncbi:aspartate/glutamate racemase family protein [Chelativorans sp. J32]|uniref:aspartate/glutamate racemase family protein n=1 Tax=Chelativorans sp. J32 TaxID=935840 RepID=UPI00048774C3|nr:aspartate/glutamate racemase family protein [Chelativorans sp. J32]
MAAKPRIVLLHATPVAVDPVKAAFAELWPEPELVNLLDDSLSPDRAKSEDLTDALIERFVAFGRYGYSTGADAILVTCSAFGPAIEQMGRELPIPVLKPNEAMFRAAVTQGRKIAMVATFRPAVVTMEAEFKEYVSETGSDATLTTIVVEPAMAALRAGDAETHNRLIAEHAPELEEFDTVMLAHFSTSRATSALASKLSIPVLSAPGAAVARLRELIA